MSSSRLIKEQVVEIRRLYNEGATMRQLGDRYGVDEKTISHAVKGRTWKEVGGVLNTADMRKSRSGGDSTRRQKLNKTAGL
jgi:IS30 family transposase